MRIFFNRQQSVLSFVTTLLLAGLLWAPQALAGTCGVLPFGVSGDVGRGAGDNITSLVRTEVDISGGFELVLTADEGEYKSSCGGDASCAKGFGRSAGHEQVIGGDVKAVGSEEYSVTAHLYEVRTGRRIRSVEQTVSRKADVLIDTIPNLVIELLTGEKPEVEEDVEEAERTRTARFDADFDEEDEDDSDLEEDDASAEAAPSWMERDRRGRKIRKDEDGGED